MKLTTLIDIASRLNMATRALRFDLADIGKLQLPCILHWEFDHFVVLKRVGVRTAKIVDPARGERSCSLKELSESCTGIALELWPNPGFQKAELKQTVKLRALLGHVTGLHRSLAQIILLAVSLEVFAIAGPFYMQWVIDNVLLSGDRELLTTLALGFATIVVIQALISALRSWALIYMGVTLNVQWRANVFSHLLRLPTEYFERRHLGDVVSRFASIDVIQHTLTTSFVEAVLDGIMASATLVVILIYSPKLALITIGAVGLYALIRWGWYRPLRAATEEQIAFFAKQQSHFLETVRGIKTIKLFMRYSERRSSWLTLLVDQLNTEVRSQKLQLLFQLANGLLIGLENILIIWLGAKAVMNGNFSVGMLVAFLSYRGQFAGRVSSLIDKAFQLKMLQVQGERLSDVVFTEPEASGAKEALLQVTEESIASSIEVRDLCFKYSEDESLVLRDVTFSVASGESVAITGSSGGGKSTLLHIMLGMLQPTSGDVLIGGISTRRIGVEALRGMVAAVTQEDTLFEGSIADNISFFDTQPDLSRVQECARLSAIHDDIVAMPMGYNTFVGYLGSILSGGQKQRVLLARALYKRPKILFLDEATSHLDAARERDVNESIRALNITRVLVAHRETTVRSADRSLRLESGRLVGSRDNPLVASQAAESEEMERGFL